MSFGFSTRGMPGSVSISWQLPFFRMSDVTYNTASFPALLKTVKNLLSLSPAACVIIAYKERHIAERTAWEMFENDAKLSLHKVEEISGPAGAPVEIWLGSQAL